MATITYSFESVVDEFVVNVVTTEDQSDADLAALRAGTSFGCAA